MRHAPSTLVVGALPFGSAVPATAVGAGGPTDPGALPAGGVVADAGDDRRASDDDAGPRWPDRGRDGRERTGRHPERRRRAAVTPSTATADEVGPTGVVLALYACAVVALLRRS